MKTKMQKYLLLKYRIYTVNVCVLVNIQLSTIVVYFTKTIKCMKNGKTSKTVKKKVAAL